MHLPFPNCHAKQKFSSFSQIVRDNNKPKPRWTPSSPRAAAAAVTPRRSYLTAPLPAQLRASAPLQRRGRPRAHDNSSEAPTPRQRRGQRTAPRRHLPPKAPKAAPRSAAPPRPPARSAGRSNSRAGAERNRHTADTAAFIRGCPGLHTEVPSAGCSGCPSFFLSSGFIAGNSSTSCENGHRGLIADGRAQPCTSLARPPLLCPPSLSALPRQTRAERGRAMRLRLPLSVQEGYEGRLR